MSLKPLKKSDIGKDWVSKRHDNKKKIHPEYHLIITEGTKTEPIAIQKNKQTIDRHGKMII